MKERYGWFSSDILQAGGRVQCHRLNCCLATNIRAERRARRGAHTDLAVAAICNPARVAGGELDAFMNPWLAARNILVIRPDNIGDVVMTGPALRAIKHSRPAAKLTLLASPGGATAAPLLPWVDDVLAWRVVWQDLGRLPFDPPRERHLIETLAARHFDAAIILTSFSQTPHAAGYLCYLAGIPLRAGAGKEFGGGVLTTELRDMPDELHQVERNLQLVEALGFTGADRRLGVHVGEDARRTARALLADLALDPDGRFVLLHPGASARARRYPAERAGALAQLLWQRGWQVLITGVEREREQVEMVARHAPAAKTLVGRASLEQYAALCQQAALIISGNTLPLHLADALDRPVICLFSGTDLEVQWQPRFTRAVLLRRPTSCHPCYLFDCPYDMECLDFAPAAVADAAEHILGAPHADVLADRVAGR